jgi:tRNA(fMet)-specific endonuclease VapC
MIDYLLDTNSVSFALKGRAPKLVERLRRTRRQRIAVSVVTAMELRFGLVRNPSLASSAAVEAFLTSTLVLPLEAFVAPVYGSVRASLERSGTPIGALDTVLAAHAIAIDATLITNNLREFQRVEGLSCEDWS